MFEFENNEFAVNQSDKKLVVKVVRKDGKNGRVIVPWSTCGCEEDSYYKVNIKKCLINSVYKKST